MKDEKELDRIELLKKRALILAELERLRGYSDTRPEMYELMHELNAIESLLQNYPFDK